MKPIVLIVASLAPCGAALAQDAGEAAYLEAVTCAGKFQWVIAASSGGQPPINEYSLNERVEGANKLEALARTRAEALDPAPDVPGDMQRISDDTIGVFFDDPEAVEADLLTCAISIGLRDS